MKAVKQTRFRAWPGPRYREKNAGKAFIVRISRPENLIGEWLIGAADARDAERVAGINLGAQVARTVKQAESKSMAYGAWERLPVKDKQKRKKRG